MTSTFETATADWSHIPVLVADDETFVIDMAMVALRKLNIGRVEIAHDGEGAIQTVKNNPNLRLVVSDWNMPNMDGLELLREVRELRPQLPFFMLTGNVTEAHVKQAVQAGVDGYIAKPFRPKDLQQKINKVLKRRYGSK